jgi:hypothetical protein
MSDETIEPESEKPTDTQPVRTSELASLHESVQRLEATQTKMLEAMGGLYEIGRRQYSHGMLARIKDVEMPFGSMVIFMIKWAIAAIPAAIILLILGAIFWFAVTLVLGGLIAGFSNFFH